MNARHAASRAGRLFPAALLLALCLAGCARGRSVGDSSSGPGGPGVPPSGAAPPTVPGLAAAAAGPGAVFLRWLAPGAPLEAALFRGASRATVYQGAPLQAPLAGSSLLVPGLPDGQEVYFGLALRSPGGPWLPSGAVLQARPGAPIFVDASADPLVADGMTPQTAFPTLFQGLLSAFAAGGANVHARGGDYAEASLPLFAGVHLFGGFDGSFALAARDADANPTTVRGPGGASSFDVRGGVPSVVLDGLVLDGSDGVRTGVDVIETSIELRAVTLRAFRDRGLRVRNGSASTEYDLRLVGCRVESNGADGLSAVGAHDVLLAGCSFDGNVQEGVELDDLVALEGETARLTVLGSRFRGNGAEGLDVDLGAPPIPGPGGGRFDVLVRGAEFVENGADGLLIDEDYELSPGWFGEIAVIGCTSRANGGNGVVIDADARADVLLHRVLSAANAGDGFWVRSETSAGIVVLSACAATGNAGVGVRASLGNKAVALTHGLLAGNLGGGLSSTTIESSAASTVAYLQSAPWSGARTDGVLAVGSTFPPTFMHAPEEWRTVVAASGASMTLDTMSTTALPGSSAELGEDGLALPVTSVQGALLVLDQAPTLARIPVGVALFPAGGGVQEDWSLAPGSPAGGAGLGLAPRDAGPFGSPAAGPLGRAEELPRSLFRVADALPAPSSSLGASQPIEVRFDRALDPLSILVGEVRAVTDTGADLAIGLQDQGDVLRITPPAGGWGSTPFRLQLLDGLRAADGTPLSTPLSLPFRP